MPPPSAPVFVALLAALACGSDHETPPSSGPPADAARELEAAQLEIATLREALASEHVEREALEAELERLRAEPAEAGASDTAGAPPGAAPPTEPWFAADDLLQHGVEPAEVDRVCEAFDRSEMALLELEDRARREGWLGTPRYWQALYEERSGLRAELGDERFDLLLYASGRRNRVVVEDLLDGSPAQRAGLQRGDEILRYDDARIFRASELKFQTTQGKPGATLAIDLVRDGSPVRVWVSSGPLGVRLGEEHRFPR